MIDKPFIYFTAAEGEIFINLLQITHTSGFIGESITLHMSSGDTINLHGNQVGALVARIADLAILPDGSGLAETVLEGIPTSESSSAAPTEAPPSEG